VHASRSIDFVSVLSVLLVGTAVFSLLHGCTHLSSAPHAEAERPTPAENSPSKEGAGARELALVERMIRSGQYSQALPRLQRIISDYPGTESAAEAEYWLGVSYYALGAYRDAQKHFNEYITAAPNARNTAQAKEYLARLQEHQAGENLSAEAVKARVHELENTLEENAEDLPAALELADLYWKQGDYSRAGSLYVRLLQTWPQLENDTVIRTRVRRQTDNTFVILTPQEALRQQAETEPLVIYNTTSFRSGRFEAWNPDVKPKYYSVTGQVANRATRVLNNVRVYVTIYGFGSKVYDTQTVHIGTLRPGENRAFSVRFSNFDDIENVSRYECVGAYD
jgi:tetratricopeptide (TPR) repeat protein